MELREYFCVTDTARRVLAVGNSLAEVQAKAKLLDWTKLEPTYVDTGFAAEPPFVGQQLLPAYPDASIVDYEGGGSDVVPHSRIDRLYPGEKILAARHWKFARVVYSTELQRALGWCEAELTGEVY